jgi:carbohydrate binding protein with CBM5/12 domain
MAIVYRTSGPWGAGKGANLVAGEVDVNFYDLDQRMVTVEDTLPEAAVGIAFFSISGSTFSVHMTDGTVQGPFELPVRAWNFRGEWLPSTVYNVDDVITANGSVYLVLVNHTSGSSFDAGANDGSGHNYYGLLLTNPANMLPDGGLTGQILAKVSDTDYDVAWQTPIVFPSQKLLTAPDPTYALTSNNIASYVRCVNVSGCTIIIPNDSSLNFPLSTEISFRQCTASAVILSPASGVTLNAIDGLLTKSGAIGAVISAKKVAANNWDVFGLLSST